MEMSYPIGRWQAPDTMDAAARQEGLAAIRDLPDRLRAAVAGLTDAQLDTPYRPGGWTVRQLIHHLADSHLNAYCRWKLALTEPHPRIKPYDQEAWATLPDSRLPPGVSLDLLTALHARWTTVLETMTEADFGRTLDHPETGPARLDRMLHHYAWHGRHHTAHVTALRSRLGW